MNAHYADCRQIFAALKRNPLASSTDGRAANLSHPIDLFGTTSVSCGGITNSFEEVS